MASTPYKAGTSDRIMRYMDESGQGLSEDENDQSNTTRMIPADETEHDKQWVDKFVDDVNGGQAHLILDGEAHISQRKESRRVNAKKCQKIYETIKKNTNTIGMKVNPKKTKLLCVSSAINYDVSSYINIDDQCLESADTMKILGYTFGSRPTTEEHVKSIRSDFAARIWAIRHLKRAKIRLQSLVIIYCSLIRSAIEYAAPVYSHFLTNKQSVRIEY